MYKISRIMAWSIIGLLTIQLYSFKLTNKTPDDLLYSCGNPVDKKVVLTKKILKASDTTEISESKNYLQIYTVQKPNVLRAKYPLSTETEDLTIVTDNMVGYKFKPTSEMGSETSTPRRSINGISLMGRRVLPGIRKAETNSSTITQPNTQPTKKKSSFFKKPLFLGKRLPTKAKPYEQIAIEQIPDFKPLTPDDEQDVIEQKSTEITETIKPLEQIAFQEKAKVIKKRFLTKRKALLSLGIGTAIGTVSCVLWWYNKLKFNF